MPGPASVHPEAQLRYTPLTSLRKSIVPAKLQIVIDCVPGSTLVITRLGWMSPGPKLMSEVGGLGAWLVGKDSMYVPVVASRPVRFIDTAFTAGGTGRTKSALGQGVVPGPSGAASRLS